MSSAQARSVTFGDRYAVVRKLGEGGMGVVYEALDKERGERVALKTAPVKSDDLYRFKQEFRSVADVSHPNLVQLYDLVTEGQELFFTMELVVGASFLAYVRADRGAGSGDEAFGGADTALDLPRSGDPAPSERPTARVAESLACDLAKLRPALRQLVRGVAALHAAGKLHRDLKPSNVLVTREGRVVVLDFGLAMDVVESRQTSVDGSLIGTPAYMSPEQAASGELTAASDWYSVGVMLHEALTGRLPFEGPVLHQLIEKQKGDPAPPGALVSGVPTDLDALCAALLRRDPATRPTGAELLSRLGPGEDAELPAPQTATQTVGIPLVGREEPLRRLEEGFEACRAGTTVLLRVHGDSGMGKSALLRHFCQKLTETAGAVVLSGRCYERESVSFKAFDNLLDALTRHLRSLPEASVGALLPGEIGTLVRVFPVLSRVKAVARARHARHPVSDPKEVRRRAFAALRECITRIAIRTPLVLWIDDLQWGDTDSAALLGALLAPPDPPPLLLLLSYRTEESATSQLIRAVVDDKDMDLSAVRVDELEVGPLAPDAGAALATMLRPSLSADQARQIATEARGSPYFVDELVRYLEAREERGELAPLRLDDALHGRIGRLPAEAIKLLDVVAIAGGPAEEEIVARTAGVSGQSARRWLALLRAERLVRGARDGGSLDTFHDRVRETVLAHLDPERGRLLHGRFAAALLAAGAADPDVLVEHFRAAGNREREAELAAAAGDKAVQALAFDRAERLFGRAIELGLGTADELRALEEKRAAALTSGGRWGEAAALRLDLAERAAPNEALSLRTLAAEQLLCSGRFDDGARVLEKVLRAVGVFVPRSPLQTLLALLVARVVLALRGHRAPDASREVSPRDRVRLDAMISAGAGFAMTDNVRGAYFQARALVAATRAGDAHRLVRALAMETCFRSTGGRRSEAHSRRLLGETRALADETKTPYATALCESAEGFIGYFLGDFAAARAHLGSAEQGFLECVGEVFLLSTVRHMLFRTLTWLGALTELRRRLAEACREAQHVGDLYGIANLVGGPQATLRLAHDELDAVREELAYVAGILPASRFLVQHYVHLVSTAQVDLYGGHPAAAIEKLERAWFPLRRSLLLRMSSVRLPYWDLRGRAHLAQAALLEGTARQGCLERVEAIARRLEKECYGWADGFAAQLSAGVHLVRGRVSEALRRAEIAERAFAQASMKLHAATSRWCLGLLEGGDAGAARVAAARAEFASEGVRRPERYAATLAPGFEGALDGPRREDERRGRDGG